MIEAGWARQQASRLRGSVPNIVYVANIDTFCMLYGVYYMFTTKLGTTVSQISNPTMEEIGTTNPKYQPLRVLWHPFVRPRSKNHTFGAHSPVY